MKKAELPAHLAEAVKGWEEECKTFGLNPYWAKEAKEKSEKEGDDFSPVHALAQW